MSGPQDWKFDSIARGLDRWHESELRFWLANPEKSASEGVLDRELLNQRYRIILDTAEDVFGEDVWSFASEVCAAAEERLKAHPEKLLPETIREVAIPIFYRMARLHRDRAARMYRELHGQTEFEAELEVLDAEWTAQYAAIPADLALALDLYDLVEDLPPIERRDRWLMWLEAEIRMLDEGIPSNGFVQEIEGWIGGSDAEHEYRMD